MEFVDQYGMIENTSIYADTEFGDGFVTCRNNLIDEDPGFVDPASFNFQLKKNSRAYTEINFEPIPVKKIGLYKDEYRKKLPEKRPWLY